MKLILGIFFFYSLAYGEPAPITPECKDSSKEVKTECSKDSFAQAWLEAFNQVPFKFSLIYDDMEKCTKSVALCYYNCSNKTLTKSSGMSSVTGALRKSYGKKPHTAEIINCRGYLSDYAKEVEGTCESQLIKEKSKMDSKDEAMKSLASKCLSFANFETPELESKDEYGQVIPPAPSVAKIDPFTYQPAAVDVTSKVKVQIANSEVKGAKAEIKGGSSVDPMKLINTMNRGEPGGKKKNNPVGAKPQPTNIGVIQSADLSTDKNSPLKKKIVGKSKASSLKKISDQLATNNYQKTDPITDPSSQKFQIAKEKAKMDQVVNDSPGFTGELSAQSGSSFHQGLSSGALGASLFHKNTKAIEQLRKSQMTLE